MYRCRDAPGWALKTSPWPTKDDRYTLTIPARRSDVGREGASDLRGQSNWSLTQRFNMEQESLAARFALVALLDIYADRLAGLRDASGGRGPGHRPVATLEISTVTSLPMASTRPRSRPTSQTSPKS